MTSTAARRMSGTTVDQAGGVPGSVRPPRRPERHLRVLPPPAVYAVAPQRRSAGRAGAAVRNERMPSPGVRLTARGRRLVAALVLAAAVGVVVLGHAVLGGGGDGLELMRATSVVVERGDTLWSIARSVAGDRDVREVIEAIQGLNGLDGAGISPGQVLHLP